MYAQLDQTVPNLIRRSTAVASEEEVTRLTLDTRAALLLEKDGAFLLVNHEVDPGKQPSQILFITATTLNRPDGSTVYQVDR